MIEELLEEIKNLKLDILLKEQQVYELLDAINENEEQ